MNQNETEVVKDAGNPAPPETKTLIERSYSFLSFDRMVSVSALQTLYGFGLISLTMWGAILTLQGFGQGNGRSVFFGLLIITLGNFSWRLACEIWILFFKIHETLISIKDKL